MKYHVLASRGLMKNHVLGLMKTHVPAFQWIIMRNPVLGIYFVLYMYYVVGSQGLLVLDFSQRYLMFQYYV